MCGSPKIDFYCLEGYCLSFSRGNNQPLGYLNTLSRGFLRTQEIRPGDWGQRGVLLEAGGIAPQRSGGGQDASQDCCNLGVRHLHMYVVYLHLQLLNRKTSLCKVE